MKSANQSESHIEIGIILVSFNFGFLFGFAGFVLHCHEKEQCSYYGQRLDEA